MKSLSKNTLQLLIFTMLSLALASCGAEHESELNDLIIENETSVDPTTVKVPTGG